MSRKAPVHVVCAVIVREDGYILIAKRPQGKRLGGFWEFPGGKVEFGEEPFSALEREIQEELGLSISKTRHLMDVSHPYEWGSIILSAYLARLLEGTLILHEHEAFHWCKSDELHSFELAPADLPIVQLLQKETWL